MTTRWIWSIVPRPVALPYRTLVLGIATSMLAACGCSPGIPLVPVHGHVTWKAAPLTRGTVTLQPYEIDAGLPRRPAVGQLQPDGSFQLTTFEPGDGAVIGKYRVTIHAYASEPSDSDSDTDVGQYVWAIPSRYGDPARSGLTADIRADQDAVELTFDLQE